MLWLAILLLGTACHCAISSSDTDAVNLSQAALQYSKAHNDAYVKDLQKLVSFPTISALGAKHTADFTKAVKWLRTRITRAGLQHVQLLPTPAGQPRCVVMICTQSPQPLLPSLYADWLHAADAPTILIYAHYDVQPVTPLDAWTTPPFNPVIRDGYLFGRGASDCKAGTLQAIHVRCWPTEGGSSHDGRTLELSDSTKMVFYVMTCHQNWLFACVHGLWGSKAPVSGTGVCAAERGARAACQRQAAAGGPGRNWQPPLGRPPDTAQAAAHCRLCVVPRWWANFGYATVVRVCSMTAAQHVLAHIAHMLAQYRLAVPCCVR